MDFRCPLALSNFPDKTCEYGKKKSERMKTGRFNVEKVLDSECVWYINDSKCHYCFFKYMQENARPHSFKEIAELWNTSINNIKLREQEALNNFKVLILQAKQKIEEKVKYLKQKAASVPKSYRHSFRRRTESKRIQRLVSKLKVYTSLLKLVQNRTY